MSSGFSVRGDRRPDREPIRDLAWCHDCGFITFYDRWPRDVYVPLFGDVQHEGPCPNCGDDYACLAGIWKLTAEGLGDAYPKALLAVVNRTEWWG